VLVDFEIDAAAIRVAKPAHNLSKNAS
jgi:hypothetical protein